MAEQLVIYLKDISNFEADWIFSELSGDITTPLESGTIAELADKNKNAILTAQKIICVIDAQILHFSYLTIPAKNKQRALQAIPFALEEQLAEEVELLHFATGKPKHNTYPVAAVKHDTLQLILDTLKQNNISVDAIYPDTLCLPQKENSWTFLNSQNNTGIDTGSDSLIQADSEMFPLILSGLLSQILDTDQLPATFEIWSESQQDMSDIFAELSLPDSIALNYHHYNASPVSLFASNLDNDQQVNLLQGSYQVVNSSQDWWKPWRAAAVLAIVAVLLELTYAGIQLNKLEKTNTSINAEITRIYKKSFPASKRIVNARVQMENKLKQLRKGSGKSGYTFTDILADAAPVLKQTPDVSIESINFNNRKLELQLVADKLSSVETLNQGLNKLARLKSELSSSSSDAKRVSARLKLEAL